MMLELYHNNMSTCSQKVRLVVREKGLAPVEHHFNLRKGDQFDPGYLKLNPDGVVPTLVHDGRPVIESTLIAEYIDEVFPAPPLRPDDLVLRAEMRRWANLPDQGIHAACATVSQCIAFRHQYLALTPAERAANLADTPDPDRRERKRLGIELGIDAPHAADAVRSFDRLLARMAAVLADGRPWLMGDRYTLADVALTPYVVRLDHLHLAWMWDARPGVAGWLDRIRARPNFPALSDYFEESYLALMAAEGDKVRDKVAAALAV
jgi:glutathione S-transferase